MGINKYHNPNYYDASLDNDIPLALGDKYYGQDLFRDLRFMMDLVGLSFHDIMGALPIFLSGGVVTQGSGANLDITAGVGWAAFEVDVVDSFASLPPTIHQLFVDAIRIAWTAQTNMNGSSADCSAYSIDNGGVNMNYVKVAYLEKDGQTRARANLPGSYSCEVIPWFTFIVNSVVPNVDNHEICIAAFTSSGGTYTFHPTDSHISATPLTLKQLAFENATIAGVKTFSSKITGNIDTADGIKETGTGAGTIHWKIIPIGDWNMDATANITITHGLAVEKIRSVMVIVRDDADDLYSDIRFGTNANDQPGGWGIIKSTNYFGLFRNAGSTYDSVAYDSTSYNRGWITIGYID